MKINPESLARASSRHPWRTIGIWVVIFVAAVAAVPRSSVTPLTTDFDFTNNPEAKQAQAPPRGSRTREGRHASRPS